MKKTRFLQFVALILTLVTVIGSMGITAAAADNSGGSNSSSGSSYDWGQISDILNAVSYSTYAKRNADAGLQKGESEIVIDVVNDFVADASDVTNEDVKKLDFDVPKSTLAELNLDRYKDFEGVDSALYLPDYGTATWKVEVPADGLYGIRILYAPVSSSTSSIERTLYINGKVPFSEARSLTLTKSWTYNYEYDANGTPYIKDDINGNDLRPSIGLTKPEWLTYECVDSNGYTVDRFEFKFDAGTNYVSLYASRESMAVKAIVLYRVENTVSYDKYIENIKNTYGATKAPADSVIKFEAEYPTFVSDTSIYASSDRTSAINTSNKFNKETNTVENVQTSPGSQYLNTIGANSYHTAGQWAAYTFTAKKTGLHNIVMRYKQTALEGMFVSRVLKISGGIYGETPTVPFHEAYYTRFAYSKDWQVNAIGNGDKTFEFYLEEGKTYTIYLEVGLGDLSAIIGTIESTLTAINNAYLEIVRLTGPEPDEYRSYNFTKIMPGTIRSLLESAKTLENVSASIKDICGTTGSHVVTLDNIARLLNTMGKDPENQIAPNLSSLKTYVGTLGTWINDSKEQSLTVDSFTVQSPDAELPEADAGFFKAAWFEISAFFKSFVVDYNSMGVTDVAHEGKTIDVWLAYGRDQSQIWRNLINDNFTPKTGIAVNLKLVTTGTLLPSVLAGAGPDAYIGLLAADTINYAIRGAVTSLNQFEDVDGYLNGEVFSQSALVPISLYGQLYGLPETMAFSMMFIREDILANMQLNVPETWDDLLKINTALVAKNMEIGIAYEATIGQMIYQSGASIWRYEEEGGIYAGSQIAYGDDLQLEIFNKVASLYIDYSFPLTFDASNRFRTGELPIVVGDYVTTYNTLIVFATEIRNVWTFTKIPGTMRADGTVDHSSTSAVTATVMLYGSDKKNEAWEFMKWQSSADMQAQYGNEMVALIGPSAKYATANLQAIEKLSWTSKELANIKDQIAELAAVANYPGNYIIQRYVQFAFMDAYNNKTDPGYEMKSYINTINKEINRKREEFGLPTIEIGSTLEQTLAQ